MLKPLIVSAKDTYLPGDPVKISATKNGCDKKRSTFLARATVVYLLQIIHLRPRDCNDIL